MATIDQCHLEAASAPAECIPEASKATPDCLLQAMNAPVIAEWYFNEGTPTYLGCKLGNAGTKVVADIRLDPSRSTALFDIRVPVELKTFTRTTYLHLLIDPVNVKGIVATRNIPDAVQSPFFGKTPGHVVGLQFDMVKPASLLGPATARVPQNKKAREAFERLISLAQVARFTLYVPFQNISHSQAQLLGSTLSDGHSYRADWPEFKRMYGGKGAVLLRWDTLETTTAPDDNASPPSYDQIGPAPPFPVDSKSSHKKTRRNSSLEANRSQKRVKFAPVNASGDTEEDEDEERSWKQKLQEEIRALRGEVKTLREEATSSSTALKEPKAMTPAGAAAEPLPTTTESIPTASEHTTSSPKPLEPRIDMLEDRINTLSDQLSRLISATESAQVSNTQQIAELKKHFDERIEAIEYMLDVEVHDARRDAQLGLDEAEARWEEWRDGARADLQSFVEEEMAEVEESIKESLRRAGREGMGATVYFDFE